MSHGDNLLLQLNRATRRWHPDADDPWLQLLRPAVTRAEYLEQLQRMYGFEAPLEGACQYTPKLASSIEVRHLRRAGLLAQDLLALGMRPSELAALPQCFSITPFKHLEEALGWLYVVERTTLLYDQIFRHLVHRLPEVEPACAYLSMFDAPSSAHWERFGRTLDRFVSRAPEVIAAAHAGFECMVDWFRATTPKVRITG
jgi:heme oxygenase